MLDKHCAAVSGFCSGTVTLNKFKSGTKVITSTFLVDHNQRTSPGTTATETISAKHVYLFRFYIAFTVYVKRIKSIADIVTMISSEQ